MDDFINLYSVDNSNVDNDNDNLEYFQQNNNPNIHWKRIMKAKHITIMHSNRKEGKEHENYVRKYN